LRPVVALDRARGVDAGGIAPGTDGRPWVDSERETF
jgi:hypothetical protein